MTSSIRRKAAGALAALAALATATGFAASANAATTSLDVSKAQSITITASDAASMAGHSFTYTQIGAFDYATSDGTNVLSYDINTPEAAKASVKAAAGTSADAANPILWVVGNLLDSGPTASPKWSGSLRDFASKLSDDPTLAKTGGPLSAPAGSKSVTLTGLNPGIYLIRDASAAGVQKSIPMVAATTIDGQSLANVAMGQIDLKAEPVSPPTKTINGKAADAAQIGKPITYVLKQTVPNTTGYDQYYLALSDALSNGLSFGSTSSVTVDSQTLVKGTDYTETVSGQTLLWEFGPKAGAKSDIAKSAVFTPGSTITVTYTATLNGNAIVLGAGNPNTVSVIHSNDPNVISDHGTIPGDTVKAYTGQFKLHKLDKQGNPLAGATFNVFEDGSSAPMTFKPVNGSYEPATGAGASADVPAGDATIAGLNGTYQVKETKAPEGFDGKLLPTFTVTIAAGANGQSVTLTQDALKFAVQDGSDPSRIDVTNVRNLVELGQTGAGGILVIGTLALVTTLIAGAVIALERRRAL